MYLYELNKLARAVADDKTHDLMPRRWLSLYNLAISGAEVEVEYKTLWSDYVEMRGAEV